MKRWIFCGAGNQVNFSSVVTRLQARQPRNYDFFPGKDKRFFVFTIVSRPAPWPAQHPVQCAPGAVF
jgi:hypothetical protein